MTTTTRDISGVMGLNQATNSVINYMSGQRNAKQMIGEFFGLREEAIYDDEGENVIDFVNDFKDEKVLKDKGVHFHPRLQEMGITAEMFDKVFINGRPDYGIKQGSTGSRPSGESEEIDSGVDAKTEKKQGLPSPKKRTRTSKK